MMIRHHNIDQTPGSKACAAAFRERSNCEQINKAELCRQFYLITTGRPVSLSGN